MYEEDRIGDVYSICLYYLVATGEGYQERIYEHFDIYNPIPSPLNKLKEMAINAHLRGKNPPVHTDDSSVYMMRRKGLLAVAFETGEDLSARGNKIYFTRKDNPDVNCDYTFTHLGEMTLLMGTKEEPRFIYIIYCENGMQKQCDGGKTENLGHLEAEEFYIDLPFMSKGIKGEPGTGGTNMGPPIPPPERK